MNKDYPPYLDYPKPYKPMTNGDRIRAMSDEELTEKFLWLISCRCCPVREECVTAKACKDTWKNWLKLPAEVDNEHR